MIGNMPPDMVAGMVRAQLDDDGAQLQLAQMLHDQLIGARVIGVTFTDATGARIDVSAAVAVVAFLGHACNRLDIARRVTWDAGDGAFVVLGAPEAA